MVLFRNTLLTILFTLICLYVFAKLFGPIPFFVQSIQTTKTDLFQVTGEGKATATPNVATLSFGVTKTANSVAEAQNQTNTTVTNILNDIKILSIDTKDITTTNYSVNPNYDYSNGQKITGYSVTQNILLKVSPIEKASKAVDIVTKDGANIVDGLSFTLDDQTMQGMQNKARQEAVSDAKQKAQSLASAAGIHLGRIVDVEETVSQPVPRPIALGAKIDTEAVQSQPTQLPTGESTYSTSVTLSYETY